uniref:HDC16013 n=1 Tax=Drosophila melanogaster TaxID=7227 RepID=Q6IJ43_DROME|nr:TPA_inf: HDC16013 [Drosophila melanogaster]
MQFPPRKKVASCNFVAADFVLLSSWLCPRHRHRFVLVGVVLFLPTSLAKLIGNISSASASGRLGGLVAPRWFLVAPGGTVGQRNSHHYFYMLAQSLWHSPRGFLAGFGGAPVPVVVAVVVVVVVLVMVVVWDERLSLCITFSMHRGAFSDATMLPAHCCNLFVAARFVGLHLEKLNQESALGNKIIIRMKP